MRRLYICNLNTNHIGVKYSKIKKLYLFLEGGGGELSELCPFLVDLMHKKRNPHFEDNRYVSQEMYFFLSMGKPF